MTLKIVPPSIHERNGFVLLALTFMSISVAAIAMTLLGPSLFGFVPMGEQFSSLSELVYAASLAPSINHIQRDADAKSTADLQAIAYSDLLTGLRNRRALQTDVEELLAANYSEDSRVALLLLDLDRFKFINDTLGHDAGDQILENLASRLIDVCDENCVCYRLGGDEFVVVYKNGPSFMDVENFCHALKTCLIAPHVVGGANVEGGGSIGITWQRADDESLSPMLMRADLALYRAKSVAGSVHRFFCEQMETEHARKQKIDEDLRDIIFNGKFSLSYAPIAFAQDLRVEHFGVLVKHDANENVVSMADYAAELKESGLIVQFDRAVLERVIADLKGAQKRRKVVLNLNSGQLRDPTFPEYVSALFDRGGVDASSFIFIFDQLEPSDGNALVASCVQELTALGVKVGSNGLDGSLTSFQMNKPNARRYLLLSNKWSAKIAFDQSSFELLVNLIRLAKGIGLNVIIEGVELAEQVKLLQDFPDVLVQGAIVGHNRQACDL